MNWRNPFLITYLAITAAGTAALGYFVYSSYNRSVEIDSQYNDAVGRLQSLQNRAPFPSRENNEKYIAFTKEYRAEYDKLVSQVATMQLPLKEITPQGFQDLLRSDVSQVIQAAEQNGVKLPDGFYLGFDQYRGALPSDAAAAPLARQLAGIRIVVDQLIVLKVREISGIERTQLPEEGTPRPADRRTPGGNAPAAPQQVAVVSPFSIVFTADQANTRSALNYIANADQFFILRTVNIESSALEGPKKSDSAAPSADPTQPSDETKSLSDVTVLVGRETLTVSLKIEMITFNNLPTAQK